MPTKLCALVVGCIYLFFGISGLVPSLVHRPPPFWFYQQMPMLGGLGYVLGWLPANLVHNIVYIILGGGGILLAVTFRSAIRYCQAMCAIGILFTFCGLLPRANYLGGPIPLFSWNVMVHAITAMVAYYFGIIYPLDMGGPPMEEGNLPGGAV